jgi:hypothetical protein
MVLYTCERCSKTFIKKCDIVRHIEARKKPCGVNNIIINPDKLFVKNMNNNENMNENIKEKEKNEIIKENNNKCIHCEKIFFKKYGLNRHLLRCKIKKDLTKNLILDNEKLKDENEKIKIENK